MGQGKKPAGELARHKVRSFQNFSINSPVINHCLRCGYKWRSNRIMGQEALFPPTRCARCRSHLWNTPRVNRQPSKEAKDKLHSIEADRDGYERLYRTEKLRREEAERQAAHYKQMYDDQEQVIQQQFTELAQAQKLIKYLQGRKR